MIKKIIVAGIFSSLIVFTVFYSSMVAHEHAHVQIYKYYGVDSTVHMDLFSGETQATSPVPNEYRGEIELAHGINEAVGYQLSPPLIAIVFLLSMIFFTQLKT